MGIEALGDAGRGKTKVLAIDPGFSGGIAVYDTVKGELEHVWPMPVTFYSKRKARKELDIDGILMLVSALADEIAVGVIERVHSMPGDGRQTMFRFGEQFGALQAILRSFGIPLIFLEPAVWKTRAGLGGKGKNASRELAIEKFGEENRIFFIRKKDDGRAEAAIMAWLVAQMINAHSANPSCVNPSQSA